MSSKAQMENHKITVARLWPKYEGRHESSAGVITGLDRNRFRTICIYLGRHSKKDNFFEKNGFTSYYVTNAKLRTFNVPAILKLAKILKQEKVDILHCHKHKAIVYGTIAAILARTPAVVGHVHGLDRTRNWFRRLLNYFLMKKIRKVLTVGEAVRKDVLDTNPYTPPDKVISLGNSIDYAKFADIQITKQEAKKLLGIQPDAFLFGTVGRLVPTKGLSYLIEAFEKVKQQMPSAQLVIVGDGRLERELKQQAAKTPCASSIHFTGYMSNVPEILRGMDIFVLSSIAEGMPRVMLEAMALQVPVIGTEVGGVPEILAGGQYGCLTSPRDSNAIAKAMVELAQNPQERERLVEKACQRVRDEYCHKAVIERLEKLYNHFMANSKKLP
jgi:glycosyltransferase involved in cell wall biosynthesis